MSAYIVDRTHIAALVRVARDGPATDRAVSPNTIWHRPTWYATDPRAAFAAAEDYPAYARAMESIRRTVSDDDSAAATAKMLTDACVASVAYRYPDDTPDDLPGPRPAYWTDPDATRWLAWIRESPRLSPVAALKAIDGYDYQSCERPEWPETEAYSFLLHLRSALISTLPGYDSAAWTLDDPAPSLAIAR